MKLVPPRIALVLVAVALATVAGGVLSFHALAGARWEAAVVVDGWRTVTALERAHALLLQADAACRDAGDSARCADADGALAHVAGELRAAAVRAVADETGVARVEASLRTFAAAVAPAEPPAAGARREAEAALTALRATESAEIARRERSAEQRAELAARVLIATGVSVLLLVAVAAFAVRSHLRERERREREHARAAELQQQLLAIVGHDLRTPLSAIAGSAALLARAPDLPSSRVPLAQRIVSSAGRMSRLVRDLLDFTRVRIEGHLPVSPEPVDLGALCRRVAQELQAARPGTLLFCEVEGDVTGEWDPVRLEQVVSNLLANAFHHGAPGRPVELRVAGGAGAVRITVHNEGPPIPDDVLPHIFDPFRRGDASAADQSGLGLGLHIARSLVEAHGGTIEVASGEGGTTFTVVLPMPGAGPTHRPGAGGAPRSPGISGDVARGTGA
ncbi:sensor histidine kinase [Anaeromyxobacter oryzisoli]|uniref:sensor histidine kinase n=1 Tax=Anaeromyxobacter oryzisoli TaxID=2925408 RepID=UPI001F575332|nr:HAMP domain-containing sensor histidine kinase [Anaeromyxobacter sp. SG63]